MNIKKILTLVLFISFSTLVIQAPSFASNTNNKVGYYKFLLKKTEKMIASGNNSPDLKGLYFYLNECIKNPSSRYAGNIDKYRIRAGISTSFNNYHFLKQENNRKPSVGKKVSFGNNSISLPSTTRPIEHNKKVSKYTKNLFPSDSYYGYDEYIGFFINEKRHINLGHSKNKIHFYIDITPDNLLYAFYNGRSEIKSHKMVIPTDTEAENKNVKKIDKPLTIPPKKLLDEIIKRFTDLDRGNPTNKLALAYLCRAYFLMKIAHFDVINKLPKQFALSFYKDGRMTSLCPLGDLSTVSKKLLDKYYALYEGLGFGIPGKEYFSEPIRHRSDYLNTFKKFNRIMSEEHKEFTNSTRVVLANMQASLGSLYGAFSMVKNEVRGEHLLKIQILRLTETLQQEWNNLEFSNTDNKNLDFFNIVVSYNTLIEKMLEFDHKLQGGY